MGCLMVHWAGGESGGALWVLVLCWSFPALGPAWVGLVGLGVWSFLEVFPLG